MPKTLLHLYVFLTGSAILALEIAASRLMAPYFGTSLFVWGNILGIVLGALAVGYYYGGRVADASPFPATLGLATWTGGVLVSAIPLVSPFILRSVTDVFSGVPFFVIVASFFGMLVLFAVPLALLGALTPIAMRIGTHDVSEVGRINGSLSAASTAGSLVGAFLPSFVLIPLYGTRFTILVSGIVLIVLGSAAIGRKRFLLGLFLPAVLLWTPPYARSAGLTILEKESAYQHIRVVAVEGRNHLIVNEGAGVQSVAIDDNGLTGGYTDALAAVPALFDAERPLSILVIGVAGGSLIRQLRFHYPERSMSIDAVEIDPMMLEIAETHFGLTETDAEMIVMDGRRHLASTDKSYDLIYVDAYHDELYVPFHMTTEEFFTIVSEHLTDDGIIAMNILGERSSGLMNYLGETTRSVFPYVTASHLPGTFNNVILASNRPVDVGRNEGGLPETLRTASEAFADRHAILEGDHLLTDNRAPVEYLTDAFLIRIVRSFQN